MGSTSIEDSGLLEQLQWKDEAYCLGDFVGRFRPPQIVRVREDLNTADQTSNNSYVHRIDEQLLAIHAVESTDMVRARDRKGREVHLPLGCSNRIELRPADFRGVCEAVAYLRDYKFFRVTQGYYSMEDENCTVATGDKLEVVSVEEASPGREGFLVVQNQNEVTIRLPLSANAGFQPLLDGREYSLKDVMFMELPVYFQFIDPPDPIGQERKVGVFNCSLGVLELQEVYRDASVICTEMAERATTVVAYPKESPLRVTGTPKDSEQYSEICSVFQDRIDLAKVSSKEFENIYASRNAVRKYQQCIEAGFARFVIEKPRVDDRSAALSPVQSDLLVNGGTVETEDRTEYPVHLSAQHQETKAMPNECHDRVEFSSGHESSNEEVGELSRKWEAECYTDGENPADLSYGPVVDVHGATVTATDDDDLGAPLTVDPGSRRRPAGKVAQAIGAASALMTALTTIGTGETEMMDTNSPAHQGEPGNSVEHDEEQEQEANQTTMRPPKPNPRKPELATQRTNQDGTNTPEELSVHDAGRRRPTPESVVGRGTPGYLENTADDCGTQRQAAVAASARPVVPPRRKRRPPPPKTNREAVVGQDTPCSEGAMNDPGNPGRAAAAEEARPIIHPRLERRATPPETHPVLPGSSPAAVCDTCQESTGSSQEETSPCVEEPTFLDKTETAEGGGGGSQEPGEGMARRASLDQKDAPHPTPIPPKIKPKPRARPRLFSTPEGCGSGAPRDGEKRDGEKERRPPPVKPKPRNRSSSQPVNSHPSAQ